MPTTVQLRPVTPADVPIFFAYEQDPVATAMAAFPARDHDSFMARWTRNLANAANRNRTILADGAVAGNIASWNHEGTREVGYWLGRAYWGRGIATRALALFLEEEPIRPLQAFVAKHNVGSRRVLEKCGFVQTGEAAEGFILTLREDLDLPA